MVTNVTGIVVGASAGDEGASIPVLLVDSAANAVLAMLAIRMLRAITAAQAQLPEHAMAEIFA